MARPCLRVQDPVTKKLHLIWLAWVFVYDLNRSLRGRCETSGTWHWHILRQLLLPSW